MESLKAILEKMEAPLVFSSRDSYRHLPLIKDFEATMTTFLRQIRDVLSMSAIPSDLDITYRNIISGFEETVLNFDKLSLESKKERIEKALLHMTELKRITEASSIATSDFRNEKSFHKLDNSVQGVEKISLPVQFIKGVGPKISAMLEKKGLKTVEDLLYFVPRKYEDRRSIKTIKSVRTGARETIIGKVAQAEIRLYRNKRVYEVTIDDGSGLLTAKWFKGNYKYLKNIFKEGIRVIMTGEVRGYLFGKDMVHPDFEVLDNDESVENLLHFKRIIPIYSETEGLHQKHIRKIMAHVIDNYSRYVLSPIPEEICKKRHLENIYTAIRNIHFPEFNEDIGTYNEMQSEAHRRLIYDEFFFLQLGLAMKRKGNILDKGITFNTGGKILQNFYNILPFSLTTAQKRVIGEIEADMAKTCSMNRLLQGDVGCGKTVVSMAAMITACENNYQAAIMAPTEILAEQHYKRIKNWVDQLGLKVVLLTGSTKDPERKKIFEKIKKNNVNIIVGTHALIQEDINFGKLGFVVVDEQHRFGVIQRAALRQKGINPDFLVMTATPIPRTLAMTVYGDLDISVIDEFPPGRKEIRTKVFFEEQRKRVYDIIRMELKKGNQVFIVYPLVEESENLDLKDATRMAEHLQAEIFPDYKVGLIHGRLKGKEKDNIMAGFLNKEINILVSTTVIEVGIDVPQASLIVIEHAERFGLSQLHQLRGRVGRSDIPSYCVLMSHHKGSEDSIKRLRVMEQTNDGFKIAEEDLAIRGPGEFMGTRQSGLPDFRIAHILRDVQILIEAKTDAFYLIERDPTLGNEDHAKLKEVLLRRWGGRLDLAKTG
jgi:ATP-dependent DNA helicase RecG